MKKLFILTTNQHSSYELFTKICDMNKHTKKIDDKEFFLIDDDSIDYTSTNRFKDLLNLAYFYLYQYEALYNYEISSVLLVTNTKISNDIITSYCMKYDAKVINVLLSDDIDAIAEQIWSEIIS